MLIERRTSINVRCAAQMATTQRCVECVYRARIAHSRIAQLPSFRPKNIKSPARRSSAASEAIMPTPRTRASTREEAKAAIFSDDNDNDKRPRRRQITCLRIVLMALGAIAFIGLSGLAGQHVERQLRMKAAQRVQSQYPKVWVEYPKQQQQQQTDGMSEPAGTDRVFHSGGRRKRLVAGGRVQHTPRLSPIVDVAHHSKGALQIR